MKKKGVFQSAKTWLLLITTTITLITASFIILDNSKIISSDLAKTSDWLSAIISALALVSGAVAVFLTYKSLTLTQNAEEGNLYYTMMERYSDGKMVNALRTLSNFREKNRIDFEAALRKWNADRLSGDESADTIEKARHIVKYFYRDLMQMVQAEYFSKELAKRICNTGGRHIFKEVILPMDKVLNPYLFEGEFDPFNEIYDELKREQKIAVKKKKICLIPARYDASRFDGKLMKELVDPYNQKRKTVIRETYERMKSYQIFDEVLVVTNSSVIKNEIEQNGGSVFFSDKTSHASGTDRIAEAAASIDADIIFNVQGDEPFIDRKPLEDLIVQMENETDEVTVASLMKKMTNPEYIKSSDYVKVTCSLSGRAINFSRSITPFPKKEATMASYFEHVGVYAFTKPALLWFAQLAPTQLEQVESVECLRFLEHDIPIKMVETNTFLLEIDTPEDLDNVNRLLTDRSISLV